MTDTANTQPSVVSGKVKETLPSGLFLVVTKAHQEIKVSPSKEFKRRSVRVLPGEEVSVRLSQFDPTRGQII